MSMNNNQDPEVDVVCKEVDEVRTKYMDMDVVGDDEKERVESVNGAESGDSTEDSETDDRGLGGIFDGNDGDDEDDVVAKQSPTKKKRKKMVNKKRVEMLCDLSVDGRPKTARKSEKKRRKKPKEEYSREQIEMVFEKLDEEGNGRLSMQNILNGFHAVNQSDKIEAGLAKKMLIYADKQHDNDSVVRLDDFLAMTRLADLWPVA